MWLLAFLLISAPRLSCEDVVKILRDAYETESFRKIPSIARESRFDRALGISYGSQGDQPYDSNFSDVLPWAHLVAPTGWSTSYRDIIVLYRGLSLQRGETFVDLGSSYGRVIGVGALLFPEVEFVGYEINPYRLQQSREWLYDHLKLKNVSIRGEDFGDRNTRFPDARVYFTYDTIRPGNFRHLRDHIFQQRRPVDLITKVGSGKSERLFRSKTPYIPQGEFASQFSQVRFRHFKAHGWLFRYQPNFAETPPDLARTPD